MEDFIILLHYHSRNGLLEAMALHEAARVLDLGGGGEEGRARERGREKGRERERKREREWEVVFFDKSAKQCTN